MKLKVARNFEFILDNFSFDKSEAQEKQGFVLEGGSGSAKTYDIIQFLMYYCELNRDKNKDILIFRQTYADLKKTVLKDFVKILKMYDLYDIKLHTRSHPQSYNLFGNIIFFTGLDGMGSHGERHDVIWGNEGMELSFEDFKQLNQRCNEFFIIDYNPSFTEHWIFNNIIPRRDTKFFRSTQLDNPFLPAGQRQEILAYEPWERGSYTVEGDSIIHQGDAISKDNQPPPNIENIEQGTADEFMWKVYGLGLRGAMEGQIFKNVKYIDSFPDIAHTYGLDYGFTCFKGDTMITTINGQVPIKDIKRGDLVLTRKGYKKVLDRFDNGIAKVITKDIGTDFGFTQISSTFEHNFNINDEWKQYGELEKGDKIYLLSNLTDEHTIDTQKENIQTTILVNGKKTGLTITKDCIVRFTSILTVKLKKVITFIMSILTLLIISPIIWFLLLLENMLKLITFLRNTIKQRKEKHKERRIATTRITGNKEERLRSKDLKSKSENVIHVNQSIRLQTRIKHIVTESAIGIGSLTQKLIVLKKNAQYAVLNSSQVNTLQKKRVVQNALINHRTITHLKTKSESYERVYDLHIEGVHEYFANGILVHNCDPSALTKFAKEGKNIYIELLCYEPTETANDLSDMMAALGVSRYVPITADSSDRFVSERKGVTKMTSELFDIGWEISKVSKTKSVMFWLLEMKDCKIHIVKNHLYGKAKVEVENYRMKEVNGILINQPHDSHNHMWDSARYAFMSHDFNSFSVSTN